MRPLWVVSELYYPEETSTGHLLTHTAEGLATDREVRVLCAQPTYSGRGHRAARHEMRRGVAIERCWSTTFPQYSLAGRLINMATISLSLFLLALRRFRRGDRVLVVTNPPLLPFVIAAAAKLRGVRAVLLIHDVYPDAIVAAGLLQSDASFTRLLAGCNRWLYRQMERIIVLGRDMGTLAAEKLPDGLARIVCIPNWADTEEVRPRERLPNALRADLGLTDRFVVQYAGNMGRTHDVESVIAAAVLLERSHPQIHFLFLGGGAKRPQMEAEVARRGLANVTFAGTQPRAEQETFLAAADLAVIPFVPGMSGVSVPSRMYNVLASGRPILAVADDDSELARVVREEGVGWVVAPRSGAEVARVIAAAASDPVLLSAMGTRARAAAEARYARPLVMDRYRALFHALEQTG